MKFGRNFDKIKNPLWVDKYVHYDMLKREKFMEAEAFKDGIIQEATSKRLDVLRRFSKPGKPYPDVSHVDDKKLFAMYHLACHTLDSLIALHQYSRVMIEVSIRTEGRRRAVVCPEFYASEGQQNWMKAKLLPLNKRYPLIKRINEASRFVEAIRAEGDKRKIDVSIVQNPTTLAERFQDLLISKEKRECLGGRKRRDEILTRDVGGETPLDLAVRSDNWSALSMMLGMLEDVKVISLPSLLLASVRFTSPKALKELVSDKWGLGQEINLWEIDRVAALYLAASLGQLEMAESLRNRTPLMIAIIQSYEDVARALLFNNTVDQSRVDKDREWNAWDHAAPKRPSISPPLSFKPLANSPLVPRPPQAETVVFVYLGILDAYDPTQAITITAPRPRPEMANLFYTKVSLARRSSGLNSEPQETSYMAYLPIVSDSYGQPWRFTAMVVFELFDSSQDMDPSQGPVATATAPVPSGPSI
ncbi:hypothetical protein QBC38DRAFT_499140 [Podospora fimiseda]|uniref:Uncharacterized protein n=1 Tax=Podospora fimiseda TaxID=252190 RepID=A0AAN7BQD8_9PEZI|nr:hypothetical protein QBC38DRAFT_499140 [Podospora fimiseda]